MPLTYEYDDNPTPPPRRRRARSDWAPPHAASASIVIPIRLQVTGPSLKDIEAYKEQLAERLAHVAQHTDDTHRIRTRHGISVKKVEVDPA